MKQGVWSRVRCLVSSSLKNETRSSEQSSFSCVKLLKKMKQGRRSTVRFLVSSSLKNETISHEDISFTVSTSLKNETGSLFNLNLWLDL